MLRILLVLLAGPHLFAQSYAVYRSSDLGASWTRASSGLPTAARINAFAASGPSILAATDRGIYLSRNEANSWQRVQPDARALSLAAQGANIFAGTDKDGLLRSTDGGQHWQPIAQGRVRYVRSLATQEGTIYAGTDNQGVFASVDNGANWQPTSSGLPPHAQIFSLVVHRGALYAGLYRNGLYKLDPQLKIWTKQSDVVPLALASSGDTLYAGHNPGGIHQRNEANPTWTQAKLPFAAQLGNAPVWEMSANKRLALAGVAAYIYRSTDQGRTWTPTENGIPTGMTGIAFLLHNNLALAAGSEPLR